MTYLADLLQRAYTVVGYAYAHRALSNDRQVVVTQPFALRPLIRGLSRDCRSVLDVGTGLMDSLGLVSCPIKLGLDAHRPYLLHRNQPDGIPINASAEDLERLFVPGAVDLVTLIDVLEHFDADTGLSTLKQAETVARKRVVLFTPRGHFPQHGYDAFGLGGEKFQEHRSAWEPEDLVELGYRVIVLKGYHGTGNASFVEAFGPTAPPVDALLAYRPTSTYAPSASARAARRRRRRAPGAPACRP